MQPVCCLFLTKRQAGGTSLLTRRPLGSISVVTNATGVCTAHQNYLPYGDYRPNDGGNITETTLNFTGQRKDDTGLLFYNARYYDPVLGRFMSADSIASRLQYGRGAART